MGFDINLEFDAAAQAAPSSFRAAVEQAASILDATFTNPVTINLQIQYGEDGIAGGSADAGPNLGSFASYSTVRADLIANAAPGDPNFNALPTGSSINGRSSVIVWDAQEKLFGMLPSNGAEVDGSADFGTGIPQADLVGVALHELCHALGRIDYGPEPDIFDFFRYTGSGLRLFSDKLPSVPAYFSLDGGNTALADYGETSDPADFLNNNLTPGDPFNEIYDNTTVQHLTSLDLTQMDVLGFNSTIVHVAPTVSAQNFSVSAAQAVSISSYFTVSNPSGDSITEYGFYDGGGGSGHFTLNGVAQADGSWFEVATANLSAVRYVGGSSTGSDALQVEVFDSTTGNWSASASLTATTVAEASASVSIDSGGGVTSQPVQMIYGTASAGGTVMIFDGTTQVGTAKVQADGDWSVGVTLSNGAQTITASEIDASGNAVISNAVSYTLSSTAPAAGILESLTPAEEIAAVYIGYFDRAPDAGGFSFWEGQYTHALVQGQSNDQALQNIANSFAPQSETLALYPFLSTSPLNPNSAADISGVDNLIVSVYSNLFARTPAVNGGGVQYWADQILRGQLPLGQAILDIANGATGADAATVLNKIVVANYFEAREVALGAGLTSVPTALLVALHSVLADVTSNPATVAAAETIAVPVSAATPSTSSSQSDATHLTISSSDEVHLTGASPSALTEHTLALVA